MTLMEDARKGLITPEIRSVAEVEGIDADLVRSCVAKGLVTIPKNIKGKSRAFGIGKYMSVKVNANIGTSRDFVNIDEEVDKAKTAVEYGADTIMDLSTGGDLDLIRFKDNGCCGCAYWYSANIPGSSIP